MSSTLRTALAAALTAALLPAFAAPAWAAVPANDEPTGAIALTKGVPTSQDTTEATTSDIDAQLNALCGAPGTDASVWYTYTPAADEPFIVTTEGSDLLETGVLVVEGDPADGNLVTCGPGGVVVFGAAGQTYTIMVFDAVPDDVNGGNVTVLVTDPPPAPEVGLTVDPRGTAFKDGTAFITGTYTSTAEGGYDGGIQGMLTQRVGRLKVTADFFVGGLYCDGTPQVWSAYAYSYNGIFAGGKASNVSIAFVCNIWSCGEGYTEGKVQLTRAKLK
nr:hypothetical protein [Propionibacterium sp.]